MIPRKMKVGRKVRSVGVDNVATKTPLLAFGEGFEPQGGISRTRRVQEETKETKRER